ncbi:MAG: disulfide bond formation protein B [Gemmataceae bacterium]
MADGSETTVSTGAAVCPCWLWAALAMAAAGSIGSLALTWGLGLTACPLCFYQRVFMLTATGSLALGVLLRELKPGRASLFALPSAMGGFAVAVFHSNLVRTGALECPNGLLDLGPAPVQSLVAFVLLLALLAGDMIQARKAGFGIPAVGLGAGLLGLVFALALIYSSPPSPPRSAFDYSKPPVVCRPALQP